MTTFLFRGSKDVVLCLVCCGITMNRAQGKYFGAKLAHDLSEDCFADGRYCKLLRNRQEQPDSVDDVD